MPSGTVSDECTMTKPSDKKSTVLGDSPHREPGWPPAKLDPALVADARMHTLTTQQLVVSGQDHFTDMETRAQKG